MSNYVPSGNQGKAKLGAPATKDGMKKPGMGGVTAGRGQKVMTCCEKPMMGKGNNPMGGKGLSWEEGK